MANDTVVFMSALNPKRNKVAAEGIGVWVAKNSLLDCAESLHCDKQNMNAISSIPDVWARPTTFEIMLRDRVPEYVAQWRGVLAIIALRLLRGFGERISFKTVVIRNPKTNRVTDFERALYTSIPSSYKDYLKNDQDSYNVEMVLLDDKPLAIVWPSILICPAIDLDKRIEGDNIVPWWQGNTQVQDPCQFIEGKERDLLVKWLKMVKGEILKDDLSLSNKDVVERCSNIATEIQNFIDDLAPYEDIELSENLCMNSKISGFARPVGAAIPQQKFTDLDFDKSNVLMKNTKGEKILVVARSLIDNKNIRNEDVNVLGCYTLANVPFSCGYGEKLVDEGKTKLNGISLDEYSAELWSDGNFFSDKICIIKQCEPKNIFPNIRGLSLITIKYRKSNCAMILPLNPEILNFLSIEEVFERIKIVVEGNDIVVSFSVPVTGIRNNRQLQFDSIELSKRFCSSDNKQIESDIVIIQREELPYVDVWPNFKSENWGTYYLFTDSKVDSWEVSLYNTQEKKVCKELRVMKRNVSIRTLDKFPQVYCFSKKIKSNEKTFGFLYADVDEIETRNDEVCTIGIDFGTSNTVAYMKIGDSKGPSKIYFDDMTFKVVVPDEVVEIIDENTKKTRDTNELRRYFIPASRQPYGKSTSMSTIFNVHPLNKNSFIGKFEEPLMRGNIYYSEDVRDTPKDFVDKSLNLKSDLKWGETEEKNESAQSFLAQYFLQCVAQAVSMGMYKFRVIYSYPEAFTDQQIDDMGRMWEKILSALKGNLLGGLTFEDIRKNSESVAVASYFKNEYRDESRANTKGMLCFDIGGGSTDIALLKGTDLLYHTSIRFAGRDILNGYLGIYRERSDLKFLKNGKSEYDNQIDNIKSSSDDDLKLYLEVFLKYYERDIYELLENRGKTKGERNLKHFLRDIGFAVAGILYYGGFLVGHLIKTGKFDNGRELPDCYIGGNASKLVRWASFGKFDNCMKKNLNYIFVEGVLFANEHVKYAENDGVNIVLSSKPKEEVAAGLVRYDEFKSIKKNSNLSLRDRIRLSKEESNVGRSVIAGECFKNLKKEDQYELTKTDMMTENIILDEMKSFENFIRTFNDVMDDEVHFSSECLIDIRGKVGETLQDRKNKANGDVRKIDVEPLFIMELKIALQKLAKGENK